MVVVGCQRDEGRCVAHHRLAHLSYVGAAVKVAHTAAVKVAHRGAERSAVRSADGAAHDGLSERGPQHRAAGERGSDHNAGRVAEQRAPVAHERGVLGSASADADEDAHGGAERGALASAFAQADDVAHHGAERPALACSDTATIEQVAHQAAVNVSHGGAEREARRRRRGGPRVPRVRPPRRAPDEHGLQLGPKADVEHELPELGPALKTRASPSRSRT
jgi:hypothetical protein